MKLDSILQRVENYEYELPADFKDEEIDEDEAFNEEDDQLYNYIFKNRQEVSSDEFEDDGELTRDDFSEDVSFSKSFSSSDTHSLTFKLRVKFKKA